MIPKEPKFKIGDTVVLKFNKKYYLCKILGAKYFEREMPEGISTWRYILSIAGYCREFSRWESELFLHDERIEECKKRGGRYRIDIDHQVYCKLSDGKEYII